MVWVLVLLASSSTTVHPPCCYQYVYTPCTRFGLEWREMRPKLLDALSTEFERFGRLVGQPSRRPTRVRRARLFSLFHSLYSF